MEIHLRTLRGRFLGSDLREKRRGRGALVRMRSLFLEAAALGGGEVPGVENLRPEGGLSSMVRP